MWFRRMRLKLLGLLLLSGAIPALATSYIGTVAVTVNATGTMTSCTGGDIGWCDSVLGLALPNHSVPFQPNFTVTLPNPFATVDDFFGALLLTYDDHSDDIFVQIGAGRYIETLEPGAQERLNLSFGGTQLPGLSMSPTPFTGTYLFVEEAHGNAFETFTLTGTISISGTLAVPEPNAGPLTVALALPFLLLPVHRRVLARPVLHWTPPQTSHRPSHQS